jgi:hypothetical protein
MSTGLLKVRHGSECQSAVQDSLLEPEDSGSDCPLTRHNPGLLLAFLLDITP